MLDVQSRLSPLTVKKIFTAISASEKQEITARTLALRLGITKRSANRFLAVLEQEGYLRLHIRPGPPPRGGRKCVYQDRAVRGTPREYQKKQR